MHGLEIIALVNPESIRRLPMFLMLIFSTSYLASLCMVFLLLKSPMVRIFGDKPDHRKVHQHVVPRLGGLGIILAFFMVFALRWQVPAEVWPQSGNQLSLALLFIAVFLAGTGALDDIHNINFKVKFLFQFILAAGITLILGHHFGRLSLFGHVLDLNQFGAIATVFWIVGVMNAFNIIDGIDGLAGGVAICGFTAAAVMSYLNGSTYLVAMNIVFIGLTAGFLRHNLSQKTKIFLGDAGSQFLGAVLALMAIEVQRLPNAHSSIFVPLLIVGYPLFDITVAMARRFLKRSGRSLGRRFGSMFVADNEHLHHRLVYLGLSHMQASFLLLLVSSSLAASGVIIAELPILGRIGVVAYLAISLFLILNRLGFIGLRPWVTFPRVKPMPSRIVGVIEPDEVFFHSLVSFKQDKFEFLSMPAKLSKFMGEDLVAVMLYNAAGEAFEERWTTALRATEYHDRPAIVIADSSDIAKVKAANPDGFKSIRFMEKPIRVPELVRELERFAMPALPARLRPRERSFSLAALALRNNARR
jgi:UDP-GlcNAc:undecaprenyl-phosphate/decaprenyl-phosphate GlcNAc-1-phosphate transferase